MTQPDLNKIAEHYAGLLKEIGADLNPEGIRATPMRAAKALVEMTEGSRMTTDQLMTMFQAECLINGKHMCAMARGVRDTHSIMKVNVMHGVFQKDQNLRSELMSRLAPNQSGVL